MPTNDKDSKEIEGIFRGVDNMAFQYEVEQQVKQGQNTCGKESEMKEKCENTKEGTMEHSAVETDVAKKSSLKMYTSVLSSPAMLLLLLSHFLLHLGIFSYFSFSTDRAIQFGGLSKAESSLLLSIIGVSNCLGRVVFGQLLDRWKQKNFINTIVMFVAMRMRIGCLSEICAEYIALYPTYVG